jgi:hypothetical protein
MIHFSIPTRFRSITNSKAASMPFAAAGKASGKLIDRPGPRIFVQHLTGVEEYSGSLD